MDLNTLHLYMEMTAAACLFFIGWINWRYNATGIYSNVMIIGTSIAAIADLTHALLPMIYPTLSDNWLMFSWGASRITLILMFLMVFLCYDIIRCRLVNLSIILATPLMLVLFLASSELLGYNSIHFSDPSFTLFSMTVNCPFNLTLLILWLVAAIILRNSSHILFPPHVYWLFMSQGIMVHAIMSFTSSDNLDIASFMAHALKVSEYYSFILIYLLYKSTLDRRSCEFRKSIPISINIKEPIKTLDTGKK